MLDSVLTRTARWGENNRESIEYLDQSSDQTLHSASVFPNLPRNKQSQVHLSPSMGFHALSSYARRIQLSNQRPSSPTISFINTDGPWADAYPPLFVNCGLQDLIVHDRTWNLVDAGSTNHGGLKSCVMFAFSTQTIYFFFYISSGSDLSDCTS